MELLKKNIFNIIFIIDMIFILLIPILSKVFIPARGSSLDYILFYSSSLITFLTVGILVGILCIKKIEK